MAIFCGLASMAVFCQNDEPISLDRAIRDSVVYLTERLEHGTRVAVLNFSASPEISSYVIEEITVFLVNGGDFIVVDRSELELLRDEIDFQLSGEVSDESAQSIGKKLGAQTIISGSLSPIGNAWRMGIRALEVETAKVQGIKTYSIRKDAALSKLMPKTIGEKVRTGALNIILGLGSYLEGDIAGGLTITAGYAAAAGFFIAEAAALDWGSPAVGVPATIGFSVAGLTLVYGFVRPFIYDRSPKAVAFLDNVKLEAVSLEYKTGLRLLYSFGW
jgi:hypothetical protein